MKSKSVLQKATRELEGVLGPLLTVRELDTQAPQIESDEAIREGIELFNKERYWESHEALEIAWRQAVGSEKEILQSVILLAAALVHLQKNEIKVALGVLGRALEKLRRHQGEHFGIDIAGLTAHVAKMHANGRIEFFKIQTLQ